MLSHRRPFLRGCGDGSCIGRVQRDAHQSRFYLEQMTGGGREICRKLSIIQIQVYHIEYGALELSASRLFMLLHFSTG